MPSGRENHENSIRVPEACSRVQGARPADASVGAVRAISGQGSNLGSLSQDAGGSC